MRRVCVIGEGAWGTALANLLAVNHNDVYLWCYDESVQRDILKTGRNNRYLPACILHSAVKPVTDKEEAVRNADIIFEAVPVKFLRTIVEQFKPYVKEQPWVIFSKGIEEQTFFFPTQIIADVLGSAVKKAVVVGPSFASDLVPKNLTGVMVAADDEQLPEDIISLVTNDYVKAYLSADLIGLQVCAAFKNVVAIALGILEGAGYNTNTRAYVFTYALTELKKLVNFFDGQEESVYGLAGIGDLVLTSLSIKSKNYQLGVALGRGQNIKDLITQGAVLPEGVNTMTSLYTLAQQEHLELVLCNLVHGIIFDTQELRDLLSIIAASFE